MDKKTQGCECGCENCTCSTHPVMMHHGSKGGDAVYALGIFGAAFYLFPGAVGINDYAIALFQSLIWPATLVYHALSLLKL
jgi:hypothetical protein